MQFWSLPGADEAFGDIGRVDRLDSRTLERGHTKTFAFWLWVWDVAHIPTRHALWVLKRGAGRAGEIIGLAPAHRRIPPPPGVRRYDLLIHVDLLEDWSPLSPRSSHSGQRGLPSSDEDDDHPLPRIEPGTWVAHVEDGQGRARSRVPRVGAVGCGPVLGGGARDHEEDGGSGSAGASRSWKDRLLGRGCYARGCDEDVIRDAHRRRSRSPAGRRHAAGRRGRPVDEKASGAPVLRATPPLPLRSAPPAAEVDPVAQFFTFSDNGRALSPPPRTDSMQLEMENAIQEALATPLAFEDGGRSPSPRRQACRAGESGDAAVSAALHHLPCSSDGRIPDGRGHPTSWLHANRQ
uniref:Uncharacterized protein n=2 Tax=Aegilops tauschii subsp. strangulata TaxID=200361 RepID=A0A453BDT6_AEGTS